MGCWVFPVPAHYKIICILSLLLKYAYTTTVVIIELSAESRLMPVSSNCALIFQHFFFSWLPYLVIWIFGIISIRVDEKVCNFFLFVGFFCAKCELNL